MRLLVLVFGAGGQLGQAMTDGLAPRHEIVARTRADLDVTDAKAVAATIASVCPDIIINCAAYNDVDGAEIDPQRALAANAWSVRSMARAAAAINATLVHYSTDFVFDGATDHPYVEADQPNPRSAYAVSKLLGEWFAAEAPRHYVLRVESLFGGLNARSSVDHLFRGIVEGRPIRAFADRTVSPSYVDDVVEATKALVERSAPCGLYHCVNDGWASWIDVARELATVAGRPHAAIEAVDMADAGLKAKRPKFAALSGAKLAAAGIVMPRWQDAIARYAKRALTSI